MVNSDENKLRLRKLETELSDVKFELEDAKNQLSEEREKRQFYQLVADFTFGWEIWLEPGGKIKYCSPSCYDLTGFTSNQIVSTQDISNLLVYEPDIQSFNNFLASFVRIFVSKISSQKQ